MRLFPWIALGTLAMSAAAAAAQPVARDRPGTFGTTDRTPRTTPEPKQPTSPSQVLPQITIGRRTGGITTRTNYEYSARGGVLGPARVELWFRGRSSLLIGAHDKVPIERSGRFTFSNGVHPDNLAKCSSSIRCLVILRVKRGGEEQVFEMPLIRQAALRRRTVRSLGQAGPLNDYEMSIVRINSEGDAAPTLGVKLEPRTEDGAPPLPKVKFEYWLHDRGGNLLLLQRKDLSRVSSASVGLVPQRPVRLSDEVGGYLDVRATSSRSTLSIRLDITESSFDIGPPARVTDKR